MAGNGMRHFMKNWFAIEAIPLYAVVSLVVGGGSLWLARAAFGPTVVWTKSNPTPWNDVKPGENTKYLDPSGKFQKSWSRDKL